jgi:hypothetical protein
VSKYKKTVTITVEFHHTLPLIPLAVTDWADEVVIIDSYRSEFWCPDCRNKGHRYGETAGGLAPIYCHCGLGKKQKELARF